MINCAHPTHFAHVLEEGGGWRARIRGLRANASEKSHAELDEAKSWTREIQWHSRATIASCRSDCRTSTLSVGAAAPIIGTSPRSVLR